MQNPLAWQRDILFLRFMHLRMHMNEPQIMQTPIKLSHTNFITSLQ
jgi:hypothetical protein